MNELPLRDIHLPDAVSGWPPAIGWWLLPLIILLLALLIYKAPEYIKKYKQRHKKIAYKKIALQELKTISENDLQAGDTLRHISGLLRRIALSYLPRENVAALTGNQWIEQLNKLSSQAVFSDEISELLINATYQAKISFDRQALISCCEQWINQLPDTSQLEEPL